MTDFLKIAKSIVVHFAHICAYGVETVKSVYNIFTILSLAQGIPKSAFMTSVCSAEMIIGSSTPASNFCHWQYPGEQF